MNQRMKNVDLNTPLSIGSSFVFPLQSKANRRDVAIGALWLLVPFVGWLLNMGHRINFVHNMMHGRDAMPAWNNYGQLLRHGLITFVGMLYYYCPAFVCAAVYFYMPHPLIGAAAVVCFLVATILIPGYMSHYCVAFDAKKMFNVRLSFSHVFAGGRAYWHAWLIAIAALSLSFLGLLAFGIGFLFTSVWFWQVAGFSFASVMTQQHGLSDGS